MPHYNFGRVAQKRSRVMSLLRHAKFGKIAQPKVTQENCTRHQFSHDALSVPNMEMLHKIQKRSHKLNTGLNYLSLSASQRMLALCTLRVNQYL